jgi:iron complex transport system ATP-binding protein
VLLEAVDIRFRYPGRSDSSDRPETFGHRSAARSDVIDGVTLHLQPGTLTGILGPNGSGKTTLLKLLSGALRPSSGRVTLDDRPLTSLPRRELARRMAVVPQDTHLAFDYTALEIVLMGRYPWLRAFEVEGPDDIAAALDALDATGTRHLAERPFPTLSGGEKQRVVIASVLAQLDVRHRHEPPPGAAPRAARPAGAFLFLDEPTASLDLRYQLEIAALVRRLHDERGMTIVLSTHDLRLVSSICSRVVLLSHGRILAEGSTSEMLTPALIGELYEIGADVAAPILA